MESTGFRQEKSGGTVLCVDDDGDILAMLEMLLKATGYCPIVACGGEEGLARFREHAKDLVAVVLDLRMPGKDGFAVAREIRRESPDLPILALSAYLVGKDLQKLQKECSDAGFTACTRKPFDLDPFLAILAKLSETYTQRQSGG
jgi:CheY-like chemotaxis protein